MSNPITDKWKELTPGDLERHYHNAFDNPSGQIVLEDLKQRCFFYKPHFSDTMSREFEGMRATLLHILNMLEPQEEVKKEEENGN